MTTSRAGSGGQLPSLIAPHYFAGQLLSDADLDALVGWTRARLSLGGRRDGFGVVSGLELRVDPRPGHEAGLLVGPGYAVGPRGEDIVVVHDEPVSLADVTLAASQDLRALHAVDLFIGAAEVRERPQPGFDTGDEVDEPGGTYSRISERFRLTAEPATTEDDPEQAAVRAFEEGYERCLEPLREFRTWMNGNERGPEQIRGWLRTRLLATEFRQTAYDLDERDREELRHEPTAAEALFCLVQHERNSFLAGVAAADRRVRIGRVWLRAAADSGARVVVALDAHRPFRRLLSDRRFPAPAGWVNAAEVIWERERVAQSTLLERGIRCGEAQQLEAPFGFKELEEALTPRLMLRPGEEVALLVYRHAPLGRRVVAVVAPEREIDIFADGEGDVVIVEHGDDEPVTTVLVEPERAPAVLGHAVVSHGGEAARRISLVVGEEISIGREGAHIVTDDSATDVELGPLRRHGVLRVEDDRVVLVVTSRIKMNLNGAGVRGEHVLHDGDVIRIGRTEIIIELEP